jgi:hypothetical protein
MFDLQGFHVYALAPNALKYNYELIAGQRVTGNFQMKCFNCWAQKNIDYLNRSIIGASDVNGQGSVLVFFSRT